MANIINASAIPANLYDDLHDVCVQIGPQVIGERFPTDSDGQPKQTLTQAESREVVEAVTRKFWRDQIVSLKANREAERARQQAVAAEPDDPFEPV